MTPIPKRCVDIQGETRFSWRAFSILAGLILATLFAIRAQSPPVPLGLETPPASFSAVRAVEHVSWIAAEPHPVGSEALVRVRERLVATFREAGLEVQTQRESVLERRHNRYIEVENVLARLKGSEGPEAVALACHYDSVPGSYGAADDGAGVAVVIEALRALKAGPRLRHDVIFLITDGEEPGLLGAQAFVRHHPWAADVKRVVNLEARGSGGPAFMFETSAGNADLIQVLAAASSHVAATSVAYEIYRKMPNGTDLTIFKQAGMRGLGFAFIDRPWDYHQPTDCMANLDLGSLQQMGEAALGLIQGFAAGDLGAGSGQGAVYFNLYGTWFLHYAQRLVPWLSILGIVMAALFLVRSFRLDEIRPGPFFLSLLILSLSLLAAGLLGAGLVRSLSPVHALWGVKHRLAFVFNPWYLLCLVGLALLIGWGLLRGLTGRLSLPNLHAAGLVTWTLVAGLVGWALPGASYLFQWPLLVALGSALVCKRWSRAQIPEALVLLLLFAPLLTVIATGLGFGVPLAAGITMLMVLSAWLLLPLLEQLKQAGLLASVGILLIVVGVLAGGLWARQTFKGRSSIGQTASAR